MEASANSSYFHSQVGDRVSEIKVVDPYRLAVIAGSKKKTDKKGAAMLARFLRPGWVREVPVPGEEIEQLRHVLQARESLVGMLRRLKNRGQAAPVGSGYA